jgi:hypothetical protein
VWGEGQGRASQLMPGASGGECLPDWVAAPRARAGAVHVRVQAFKGL